MRYWPLLWAAQVKHSAHYANHNARRMAYNASLTGYCKTGYVCLSILIVCKIELHAHAASLYTITI